MLLLRNDISLIIDLFRWIDEMFWQHTQQLQFLLATVTPCSWWGNSIIFFVLSLNFARILKFLLTENWKVSPLFIRIIICFNILVFQILIFDNFNTILENKNLVGNQRFSSTNKRKQRRSRMNPRAGHQLAFNVAISKLSPLWKQKNIVIRRVSRTIDLCEVWAIETLGVRPQQLERLLQWSNDGSRSHRCISLAQPPTPSIYHRLPSSYMRFPLVVIHFIFSFFSSYSARSVCFRHTHYRTYFLILLRSSHFFLYHNDFDMHTSLSIYETTNQTTQMVFALTGLCIIYIIDQIKTFINFFIFIYLFRSSYFCMPTY